MNQTENNKLVQFYVFNQGLESEAQKQKRIKKYNLMSLLLIWLSVVLLFMHMIGIKEKNAQNIPTAKRVDGYTLSRQHDERSKLLLRNALQRSKLTQKEMDELNLDK